MRSFRFPVFFSGENCAGVFQWWGCSRVIRGNDKTAHYGAYVVVEVLNDGVSLRHFGDDTVEGSGLGADGFARTRH